MGRTEISNASVTQVTSDYDEIVFSGTRRRSLAIHRIEDLLNGLEPVLLEYAS